MKARRSSASGAKSRSPSPAAAATAAAAAARETSFEFGGPLGAGVTMLALPCVIVGLYAACSAAASTASGKGVPEHAAVDQSGGCVAVNDTQGFVAALRAVLSPADALLSPWALKVVAGWILLQGCLERLLPAQVVEGVRLADDSRLRYRINGLLAFWVSVVLVCHAYPEVVNPNGWVRLGPFPLAVIYDEYLHLAVAAIAISWGLAVYLYIASFGAARHDGVARLLARGGQTGWKVYDFFMGRELNPRACTYSNTCTSAAPRKRFPVGRTPHSH